jgi:anti-sigma factor RsiW
MCENGITFEQLVAYASGELSGADAAIVEAYLAAAPHRAEKLQRLRHAIETMRRDDSAAPAPDAVRRARALWLQRAESTALAWLRQAERLVATVVFDSRQRLALPGFRGGASTYQMAFECDAGRVDLQVLPRPQPAGGTWRLRGQVAPAGDTTVESAALVSGGTAEAVAETTPDRHGRFKIDAAPGDYDLLVQLDGGQRVIVAPGLALGADVE